MTNEEKRQMTVDLAEKVMGWRQVYAFEGTGHYHYKYESSSGGWFYIDAEQSRPKPWNPLENIADAWMLVEALRNRGVNAVITASGHSEQYGCFLVDDIWALGKPVNRVPEDLDSKHLRGWHVSGCVAGAICRAALKAASK